VFWFLQREEQKTRLDKKVTPSAAGIPEKVTEGTGTKNKKGDAKCGTG